MPTGIYQRKEGIKYGRTELCEHGILGKRKCKECNTIRNRKSRIKRKAERAQNLRDWRAANKEHVREWGRKQLEARGDSLRIINKKIQLRRSYNLTLEDYETMLMEQNFECPICWNRLDLNSQYGKGNCIDHNHKTKEVRGILCANCNLMMGHAKENIETLKNAVKYIESRKLVSV